jgi:serine/threonine-protein kinase RsbW
LPEEASLELAVRADPGALVILRQVAAVFARTVGADEEAVEAIAVAVNEAATNAIMHAYRAGEQGPLRLAASVGGRVLVIAVSDEGIGERAEARRGDDVGRGFPLMKTLSRGVDVQRGRRGTRVCLRFPVGG